MTGSVSALKDVATRFCLWMRQEALPLWAAAARDPVGGFFEDLDLQGRPRREQIRRTRVQPRQAYVYAHAARLGWCTDGQSLSDHAFDYLLTQAAYGDPLDNEKFDGFAHRLTPDGRIAMSTRDSYDHAFVLLACAWRMAAFGDDRSRQVMTATLHFLDQHCLHPEGGFSEGRPAALPRRQNPHMHLFEAFLGLDMEARIEGALTRATSLYELFQTRFFDKKNGVLREFFTDDWSPDPEKWHLVEPGHMMEWCWLLHEYSRATGLETSSYIHQLYQNAEELGLDSKSGFLWDTVSMDSSRPHAQTRRIWVQTEYLKATLIFAKQGQHDMMTKAADLLDQFIAAYLNTEVAGGYVDQFNADGEIISEAIPTSTLYHLISAAAETDRTLQLLS